MLKRINIVLPEATIQTIDRMTRPGHRSRFIDRAVQHYVESASLHALEEQLKNAALRDRDLDLEIAEDWAATDKDPWQNPTGRRGAKSTSPRSTRR